MKVKEKERLIRECYVFIRLETTEGVGFKARTVVVRVERWMLCLVNL